MGAFYSKAKLPKYEDGHVPVSTAKAEILGELPSLSHPFS
jgi:hypothetical protein